MTDLDLTPRGERIVDLYGRSRAEDFRPFGTWHSEWVEPEHRAALGCALKEAAVLARRLRRSELGDLIQHLGGFVGRNADGSLAGHERKAALQTYFTNKLIDVWFPRVFVNEKPADTESASRGCSAASTPDRRLHTGDPR